MGSMWIGAQFSDKWRGGYGPSMNRVRKGELPWLNIDVLHRMILDDLLDEFEITGLSEAEKDHLNRVWHRLTPWSDAISGLQRLRERFIVAPCPTVTSPCSPIWRNTPGCRGTAFCPQSWLSITNRIQRSTKPPPTCWDFHQAK